MSDAKDSLGDIAKILDSKTAGKVYDDMLAPTAKEVGEISQQTVHGLGLLAAPFRLMSILRVRLDRWYERVTSRVPPERQTEAPAMIAGPALEKMRFTEEGSI